MYNVKPFRIVTTTPLPRYNESMIIKMEKNKN
jgi:hypothetical protein